MTTFTRDYKAPGAMIKEIAEACASQIPVESKGEVRTETLTDAEIQGVQNRDIVPLKNILRHIYRPTDKREDALKAIENYCLPLRKEDPERIWLETLTLKALSL